MPLFRSFQPGNYLSTLNIKTQGLYTESILGKLYSKFFFSGPSNKKITWNILQFLGSLFSVIWGIWVWRGKVFYFLPLLFFFTASSVKTGRIGTADPGLFHKRVKIYLCATGQWRGYWRINQQKPCDLEITFFLSLKKGCCCSYISWAKVTRYFIVVFFLLYWVA